ncbi:relaxase/mobilization nuclease domain-containing protein, partial [Acuticoccus sp. M5D2P5]|uniref:relaxase/mobilization nuclease domain-containing protein n=1 Tax=Acuticoccus kalidii TaxID=2910977 RepID=UPI001F416777
DEAAAERAGRAWAEEMFGSGAYGGDSFDYYTAFHTDRDHPHIHVVVHRRGLDNGTWLKVSKRSAFNYQAMRGLAVTVGQDDLDDI